MKNEKIVLIAMLAAIMVVQFASAATVGQAVIVNLLNQDPDPAYSGNTVELRFAVQNVGDQSTGNYYIEVLPEYPFEMVPGEDLTKKIGVLTPSIAGNNMQIVKFNVKIDKDANAGEFTIPLLVYEEGKRNPQEKRLFTLNVEGMESAEIIYIDQVELIPGQITPLKFTINNVGSTPLRDLSFQWENEDDIILPVGSDNTKYIKYIDVGDSAELKFDVIASTIADPNLYKLDLSLTYKDPVSGENTEINTKAGVYVGGSTDFDVAFSGSSSGESSFSIANIGSVAATSVTVNIPDQPGWKVTGSNSVIIGNLNEGDYTIASFQLSSISQAFSQASEQQADRQQFQRNMSSSQNSDSSKITINIVYTDSRGNRKTIAKEVALELSGTQMTTSSASSSSDYASGFRTRQTRSSPFQIILNNAVWIVLGAVLIVSVIVVRIKYKKGRLKDPDYTYKKAIRDILRRKKPAK